SRRGGRRRICRSLFGNYIFSGRLVCSKVINELTWNGRFAVVSGGIFQKQIAFLRVKCEHLIDPIHERAKFFFKQRRHRVCFSLRRFCHQLPVSFIEFVLQTDFEFELLLFVGNVFAKSIEREKQDETNGCEGKKDLKLVRQASHVEALF